MKSDKVNSDAKVALRPTYSAAETDSPAGKNETVRMGSCEKPTMPAAEICVLLKPVSLEDMDACTKFVDGVRKVVCPSFFAKHMTQYRRTALLAMIQI